MMKSFSGKTWSDAPELNDISRLLEILLEKRNIHKKKTQEHQAFFKAQWEHLHDPFEFFEMEKACQRITQAIKNKERIIIFGDFDTDGITATTILVSGLKELGALVSYRIPDRAKDSHGLKTYLIDGIIETKTTLIITCDCGINDKKEVEYAKSKGIDVIITDHHEAEDVAGSALAILNPKIPNCPYPEKNLSGSAIAFKLLHALTTKYITDPIAIKQKLQKYLEIAAIGIVADCVPLSGECRTMTQLGLVHMKNTQWGGLKILLEQNNVLPETINEETIGFTIAPRLNAASRIGNVLTATQLFLGASSDFKNRCDDLENLNKQRKECTDASIKEAEKQINLDSKFQCLIKPHWKAGILGLIAGRFSENLNQAIIACNEKEGGYVSASCRSPQGISIIKALSAQSHLFEKFGGHDGAAGFLIKKENFAELKNQLHNYFEKTNPVPNAMNIDSFIEPDMCNHDLLAFIKTLAPFGMGNPAPIFGIKNMIIDDFSLMGAQKNHIRIKGLKNNQEIEIVGFFIEKMLPHLKRGDTIDILCTLSENIWKGESRIQLRLVDGRMSI